MSGFFMVLRSTRNKTGLTDFRHAVLRGIAPDGGLFHPVERFDLAPIFQNPPRDFQEFSLRALAILLKDACSLDELEKIIEEAFYFSPELQQVHEQLSLLNLSTGKTAAFKDYGASFLAACMSHFSDAPRVILTATSGDTGSAVAQAFYKKQNIQVVVLYPDGGVSRLQEQQMATLGENIACLAVAGSFDDCQAMVKQCFADDSLCEKVPLSSANSINIGRLIPQTLYYLYARAVLDKHCRFCVPSGNFGNIVAAMLAQYWGMDCGRFLAACNANDTVPKFLATDHYDAQPSIQTYANAMDVGNPSNFERFLLLCEQRNMSPQEMVSARSVSDDSILAEMKRYHQTYGTYICPHTATGTYYAEQEIAKGASEHIICVSTADAGKFSETVEQACGTPPPLPPQLQGLEDKPLHVKNIAVDIDALKRYLVKEYAFE